MSDKNASQTPSLNDEELFCPNCGSNICQMRDQDVRFLNVCYDCNEDNYTCLKCNKVITNSEIINELILRVNPKSSLEHD